MISTNPRKLPSQARSRHTVETMLEATAQVLVQHGYKNATTARIAERAGISIGSIYQYFPNKDALIGTLVDRHACALGDVIDTALEQSRGKTLEEGVMILIRATLDMQRISPDLHRILNQQVPQVGRMAQIRQTIDHLTRAIETFLKGHAECLSRSCDVAMAAMMIETVMESVIHRALAECPTDLKNGRIEKELYRLICGYLRAA